ncbi:unnamed protein product [Dovyalis caffra]|uniref:rhamnogalacturonan endolyase n=1 Tax=Dovyalis caffra TaxID=77055 RepID=A0AAV1SFT0_9ROSI|nr:unnamed protein product [Dovyalis caffra]
MSYTAEFLLSDRARKVVIDNGIVQLTLSKPNGLVRGVKYNGIEDLLENDAYKGYWDIVWSKPGGRDSTDMLKATEFRVVTENEDQVELSFTKSWNSSHGHNSAVPLNIDKRYIMRRGSSGFYMYAILERLKGWPDVNMNQIRIVFKLKNQRFRYIAISDEIQRFMPTPKDRKAGQTLAYAEAVRLTHTSNPLFRGEVDDKYQYAMESKDDKVHGWISQDGAVGFWMITPSQEFRSGGPIKQDLTAHVGPTILSMFTSTHYTGMDLDTKYRTGEGWKKVFGPIFVYLNSIPSRKDYRSLWDDAKKQASSMSIEENQWPYNNLTRSEDFPSADQRGTVSGQLVIRDLFMYKSLKSASYAYIGLAVPGAAGSWQFDSKGYQFWTRADKKGYFSIKNVRAGDYNLYAWVPGIIGDYKHEVNISIKPGTVTLGNAGSNINLGLLRYGPPRNGPTLWEIGIPDRSAAEFFVPDPYPTLENRLFNNLTKHKNAGKNTYNPTTWQIKFELENVNQTGHYTFQLALASAHICALQVRFNDPSAGRPHFQTRLIGKDNAIARHRIRGLYRFYSVDVLGQHLLKGQNTVYLTLSRIRNAFEGILYDYIRLEGPA